MVIGSNLEKLNITASLAQQLAVVVAQPKYDPEYKYGDLYTQFFKIVEENIDQLVALNAGLLSERLRVIGDIGFLKTPTSIAYNLIKFKYTQPDKPALEQAEERLKEINKQIDSFHNFIISIYDNDNEILIKTHKILREKIPDGVKISKALEDKGKKINRDTISPQEAGSATGRFSAMLDPNFKPQHTTSLSTRRTYAHHKKRDNAIVELRFGTQGQRHEGKERASPLFKLYLEAQQYQFLQQKPETSPTSIPITHVYFNNLGRDRVKNIKDPFNEGPKERALTDALHSLEDSHKNIAIITLPADKGIMAHKEMLSQTKKDYQYQTVFNDFLEIALEEDPKHSRIKVKDFHISQDIRMKVFGSDTKEKETLTALLKESFEAMGVNPDSEFDNRQRQAVWFHFNKYVLPKYILDELNPKTFNFSCKDAIDRGGVSSAYYNLMESIDLEEPMSRDEFEQALHAAPAMVKGRGMNHHIDLIWNAVNSYINAHYLTVKSDPKQKWMLDWRKDNCPHARIKELLPTFIQEAKEDLEAWREDRVDSELNQRINKAQEILDEVGHVQSKEISSRSNLLKVVVQTPKVFLDPNEANLKRYDHTADEVNASGFKKLGQMLRGALSSFTSLFNKEDNQNKHKLSRTMKDALRELRQTQAKPVENIEENHNNTTTITYG